MAPIITPAPNKAEALTLNFPSEVPDGDVHFMVLFSLDLKTLPKNVRPQMAPLKRIRQQVFSIRNIFFYIYTKTIITAPIKV